MDLPKLKAEHQGIEASAERFRLALLHEVQSLLGAVTLGVPIESRVKTWQSIEERLGRKPIELAKILELDDLVGLRIILLFRRDLDEALAKLRSTFDVLSISAPKGELETIRYDSRAHRPRLCRPAAGVGASSIGIQARENFFL